jgi:Ca2+/Na+ antiporter
MNLRKFFTYDYLFKIDTITFPRSDKLYLLLGGVLIGLAIILRVAAAVSASPVDRKYLIRLFKMLLAIGIFEALWFGARYQNVMFFGTHIVAWFIFLVGLVWFVFIAVSFYKNYSREKEIWEKQQVKLKYLQK